MNQHSDANKNKRAINSVQDLACHPVWKYFLELSTVPRPSKHEERVREWVVSFAKQWDIEHRHDDFGNIVFDIPASDAAYKNTSRVVIQSHLDMVCEKDAGVEHDFFKDPLHLRIVNDSEGAWCMASGTTLGADNGIGVAMALALADPAYKHPHGPLQLLFTLDEETGLNGAGALGHDMLKSPYLINIDNAQEGVLCIGCAGGRDFIATMPIVTSMVETADESAAKYELVVDGLRGGHSGIEIFDGRGNAIKILEWALSALRDECPRCEVCAIDGGEKRNAIPRFARALVRVPGDITNKAVACVQSFAVRVSQSVPPDDAETLQVVLRSYERSGEDEKNHAAERYAYVMSPKSVESVCRAIRLCPHGVVQRRGLTSDDSSLSNNLASIRTADNVVEIVNNSRFILQSQDEYMRRLFESVFAADSVSMNTDNAYTSWEPAQKSCLQRIFVDVYKKHYGTPPDIRCVHAGLECGLIKERSTMCDLDMISIGSDIRFLHSPQERANIDSVDRMWCLLLDILVSL